VLKDVGNKMANGNVLLLAGQLVNTYLQLYRVECLCGLQYELVLCIVKKPSVQMCKSNSPFQGPSEKNSVQTEYREFMRYISKYATDFIWGKQAKSFTIYPTVYILYLLLSAEISFCFRSVVPKNLFTSLLYFLLKESKSYILYSGTIISRNKLRSFENRELHFLC
jgi:hypothetical protein